MSKFLWVLSAVLTALPILIAVKRQHANIALVCVMSFFFSWTIIGWVIAIAWAIWGKADPREFSKQSGDGI